MQYGFHWSTIYNDAHDYAQYLIIAWATYDVHPWAWTFDVRGIDFMGSFMSLHGMKYILVADDYVSKWV